MELKTGQAGRRTRQPPSWLLALLLAGPLVGLTAWVMHRAAHPPSATASGPLPGLPAPRADLAEDRLEDRVDGAADALRAQGCRRLLYFRFDEPPSDAEVLVFRSVDGARATMAREAGPERSVGPGEEAQVSEQAIYFRRGAVFVRLFLDPDAGSSADRLARRAEDVDRALARGRL